MVASKARQPATKATKPPTAKQQAILKTKQEHPDLTTREIAAICDTGHTHVIATFQRYGVNQQHINDYKANRADILAGLQHRLLASVTDADIQKSPMGSRVLAAAQLYDKERLERGQSTDNVNVLVAGLRDLQSRRRMDDTVDK